MQPTLRIVTVEESADQFKVWRTLPSYVDIDNHPLSGGFARNYYPLVFGKDRRDASFAVLKDENRDLIVLCSLGADVVDYYGQPIALFGDAVTGAGQNPSIDRAFDHLAALAGMHRSLSIRADERIPAISAACSKRGFAATQSFKGLCDLSMGEAGLRAALRRSYRSLVNWGRRNLRMRFVNGSNPDHSAFSEYQAFHHRIAGRTTRPQDTWDAMYDWISRGNGELVLGYLGDELIAGTMIVDGRTTAYYASGVYDRDHFDKPVGHWPTHIAILRSINRGMKWFEVGDIPAKGTVSNKEYNIGQFKKGFVTEIKPWTHWTLSRPEKHENNAHRDHA